MDIIIIGVKKYIIVKDNIYVLYVISFGINICDNPVKHISGNLFNGLFELIPLKKIILKNVIIKIHIKKNNDLIMVDVNIENTITLTHIINGE
jgi:hypothetical protein